MLVKRFSVRNYRSITNADLPLHNFSVLVGPNNEGKSNIIRALVITLNYISRERGVANVNLGIRKRGRRFRPVKMLPRITYVWEKDFPMKLQADMPKGKSTFTIDFELGKLEKYELKRLTKLDLAGDLRVRIECGKENETETRFFDTTKPKAKLEVARYLLFQFFKKRLSVQNIDAIRTPSTTKEVVQDMLSTELSVLENDKRYRKLIEEINELQSPILEKLSNSLSRSISSFRLGIKRINVHPSDLERHLDSSCSITVDDGTETPLEAKGDGIKSLLAISIIQHAAKQKSLNKSIFLAIEEPEAHLHPKAIRELRKTLEEISQSNQVIITTHSPLLVDRLNISRNLLVSKSEATAARNIKTIRTLLGVSLSDTLQNAQIAIVVEGQEDERILRTWLCALSENIKKAIKEGRLVIEPLGGCNKLEDKLNQWQNNLGQVVVFLDSDTSGWDAFERAKSKNMIADKDTVFAKHRGFRESEIEDLIEVETYHQEVLNEFNAKLEGNVFRNSKKKWSERVKDTFNAQGLAYGDRTKMAVKNLVAERVERTGIRSLKKICRPCIETVVRGIEGYLEPH